MAYRSYPNPTRALRQLDRHGRTLTAVPLSELSTEDLCVLATGRPGGPTMEEVSEVARRVQRTANSVGAIFEKVRLMAVSIGVPNAQSGLVVRPPA